MTKRGKNYEERTFELHGDNVYRYKAKLEAWQKAQDAPNLKRKFTGIESQTFSLGNCICQAEYIVGATAHITLASTSHQRIDEGTSELAKRIITKGDKN